ncbi:hypothetical protein Tco_0534469 [Tanacetum coccineum]
MSTPKFAKTHNLVAFLEKPEESNGFEEIIDFLNASSVQYALTVNPTIYTSCIDQFWTSAKVKTVNGECLILGDNAPIEPTTEETTLEGHVSTPSYDLPQSGEDRMQLAKLMNLCTNLQEKVLDLEKAKTAQAKEITSLKKRVKQLEKRRKSRTLGLRRLRKEDASKQGRKIKDLDVDAEATLVNETQEINDDNLMFDTGVLEEQEVEFKKVVAEPDELTLAQTLIEIKTTKPKPVTTAATTVTICSVAAGRIEEKDSYKGKMKKRPT